jgi:multidrug transporter EmrE-like cation transporter
MTAIAALVTMIGCTVVANLLLKAGSGDAPSPVLLGIFSWRTIGGLAAFACAGLVYTRVLRFLPLNVAQSYAAAQFVAVILGSRLVLGEAIPAARWLGISMIVLGILVVAWHEA